MPPTSFHFLCLATTYDTFPNFWLAIHIFVAAIIPAFVYGFRCRWRLSWQQWSVSLSVVGVLITIAALDIQRSRGNFFEFIGFWFLHYCISAPFVLFISGLFTALTWRVHHRMHSRRILPTIGDRLESILIWTVASSLVAAILGGVYFGMDGGETLFAFGTLMTIGPGIVFGLIAGIVAAIFHKQTHRYAAIALSIPLLLVLHFVWNPVSYLPARLTSSDGTVFVFDPGETRHLVAKGSNEIFLGLESYPRDLHIAGDLAIFSFSRGGGEVYAYNLKTGKLAWEFDAATLLSDFTKSRYSRISIDRTKVLVSFDQTVFALDVSTGKLLWKTPLPRQALRVYDSPWTTFGRIGGVLIIRCYENLIAIRAETGQLIWSFDFNPFDSPPGQLSSSSFPRPDSKLDLSALVVTCDGTTPSGYDLKFISRREIPPNEDIWWSLKPPPEPAVDSEDTNLTLRLRDSQYSYDIDITVPLAEQGKANIKFGGLIETAELREGRRRILSVNR